jgi:hypothetical protein
MISAPDCERAISVMRRRRVPSSVTCTRSVCPLVPARASFKTKPSPPSSSVIDAGWPVPLMIRTITASVPPF